MIPEGWKEYKLGEIASIKGGKRLPKGELLINLRNSHPYIRVTDMGGKYISKGNLLFVPDSIFSKIKRYIVNTDDIILSIVGTIGLVSYITEDLDNASLTENCIKISSLDRSLNSQFLFYFLSSKNGQDEIKKGIVGSTQPKLPLYNIQKIVISVPSENIQSQIASILSSLDDKIELNLQMNKTLEAIAQAIFKEWFVDFRFPGFDGELVDGMPRKWERSVLKEICLKITKGTTPTTLNNAFVDKGINFIKVESINDQGYFLPEKFAFIDEKTNQLLNRSKLEENDILFTIAGTLCRVAKVDKSILPANTNQAVAIIRLDKTINNNYIYLLLRSNPFKKIIQSKAVHAVQANISLGVIGDTDIAIPDNKALKNFNMVIDPILKKIKANTIQIMTLAAIRDSLLPKLINGKIRIPENDLAPK